VGLQGPQGLPGPQGAPCWEDIGDVNGDGIESAADCRYEESKIYSAQEVNDFVRGSMANVLNLPDSKSIVLNIQKPDSEPNFGNYCVNVNLEKPCGGQNGCSLILKAKVTSTQNDDMSANRWQLISEDYGPFYNPNDDSEPYIQQESGVTYLSIDNGSNHRHAVTGDPYAVPTSLALSPSNLILIENYARSDCTNFDLSAQSPVHSTTHMFTIAVRWDVLASIIITH